MNRYDIAQFGLSFFVVFCGFINKSELCYKLKSIEYVSHIEQPAGGSYVFLADSRPRPHDEQSITRFFDLLSSSLVTRHGPNQFGPALAAPAGDFKVFAPELLMSDYDMGDGGHVFRIC